MNSLLSYFPDIFVFVKEHQMHDVMGFRILAVIDLQVLAEKVGCGFRHFMDRYYFIFVNEYKQTASVKQATSL